MVQLWSELTKGNIMEQYVQPFIDTCIKVFNDFLGFKPEPQVPYFIDRNEPFLWDISGVIGLSGEAEGAVSLSMKQDFACFITATLAEEEHNSLDGIVVDAVGEIVNIIAGNVKKELEEVYKLKISLPTIITGENHETIWPIKNLRAVCIPFVANNTYNFVLSVVLKGND